MPIVTLISSPFLILDPENLFAQTLSKWFYDTFISIAMRITRCGSFIGEGLGLSDVSYGGDEGFT
jgi:hypothetical protein